MAGTLSTMSRLPSAALSTSALLLGLTLALTGCGDSPDRKGDDKETSSSTDEETDKEDTESGKVACDDVKSGSTSDGVDVTGEFGKTQTAKFDAPLKAEELQRTEVTVGKGKLPKPDDELDIVLSVYSGKSGESLGTDSTAVTSGDPQMPDAFRVAIDCVTAGTRSVVTVPVEDVYGEQGNPQLGVEPGDTLVIVVDVVGPKKPLVPAPWTGQKPVVTFPDGKPPTLKLPAGGPAKTLMLEVLRPGDGAVVGDGDEVTLDYQGTNWATGEIFDQSYGKSPASFTTDGVVPGFGAALVGQKVGSRVVVTIPPVYAYGEAGSGHELAGQTLVFVIEIKATKAS